MALSPNSERRLIGVHPHLVAIVRRASKANLGGLSFIVTCGPRSVEEQKRLVKAGASKTMRSRHLPGAKSGLSHAVDLAAVLDGDVRWDWPLYAKLAVVMKAAAKAEGVPLEWGGDWKSFKDGPHFQLPWDKYPG